MAHKTGSFAACPEQCEARTASTREDRHEIGEVSDVLPITFKSISFGANRPPSLQMGYIVLVHRRK
jgi:hypothetical protein